MADDKDEGWGCGCLVMVLIVVGVFYLFGAFDNWLKPKPPPPPPPISARLPVIPAIYPIAGRGLAISGLTPQAPTTTPPTYQAAAIT